MASRGGDVDVEGVDGGERKGESRKDVDSCLQSRGLGETICVGYGPEETICVSHAISSFSFAK